MDPIVLRMNFFSTKVCLPNTSRQQITVHYAYQQVSPIFIVEEYLSRCMVHVHEDYKHYKANDNTYTFN